MVLFVEVGFVIKWYDKYFNFNKLFFLFLNLFAC